MLFDLMMKPIDSYWKRRFNAERIRANKASADLQYAEGVRREQERDIAALSERDLKQARAITAFTKDAEESRKKISEMQYILCAKDKEIELLNQALKAEREAKEQYQLTQKLWDEKKERIAAAPSALRNETLQENRREGAGL